MGIGKTIEAALIARELLDRGEMQRLAVLCPPHLAEQWVERTARKFGIDAVAGAAQHRAAAGTRLPTSGRACSTATRMWSCQPGSREE